MIVGLLICIRCATKGGGRVNGFLSLEQCLGRLMHLILVCKLLTMPWCGLLACDLSPSLGSVCFFCLQYTLTQNEDELDKEIGVGVLYLICSLYVLIDLCFEDFSDLGILGGQ